METDGHQRPTAHRRPSGGSGTEIPPPAVEGGVRSAVAEPGQVAIPDFPQVTSLACTVALWVRRPSLASVAEFRVALSTPVLGEAR
jgi:hypothetical protein